MADSPAKSMSSIRAIRRSTELRLSRAWRTWRLRLISLLSQRRRRRSQASSVMRPNAVSGSAVIITAGLGHGPGSLASICEQAARAKGLRLRWAELPWPDGAARQAQRGLRRPDAAGRRPRTDLAVGRHCCRHGRLGRRPFGRFFCGRVDRRPARCRFRGSARLLRARFTHPCNPALHRIDQGRRASSCRPPGPRRASSRSSSSRQDAMWKPPARPQRIPARSPVPTMSTTPRFGGPACCG